MSSNTPTPFTTEPQAPQLHLAKTSLMQPHATIVPLQHHTATFHHPPIPHTMFHATHMSDHYSIALEMPGKLKIS